jgi:hypothetical protein
MNSTIITSNSTTSAADQATIDSLNSIYNTMLFYYLVILMPVGLATNLLSIMIFARTPLNSTTMGAYSSFLGLGNIAALLFFTFIQNSILTLGGINLLTTSDLACRLIYLSRRTIREISPMIETLLTVDRFIEVFYPAKFPFLKKKLVILSFVLAGYVALLVISFENALFVLFRRNGWCE